jgi:NADH dehydrogenase
MSALGADEHGPSHYLRSEGLAERHVRAAPLTLDWTIIRPSVIFGARDSLTNRFAALLRLSRGIMPLARANARFAPVWVEDVASAFDRALHGGPTSRASFDLCGPEIMTLADLVRCRRRTRGYTRARCRTARCARSFAGSGHGFPARQALLPRQLPFADRRQSCRDDGCTRLGIRPAALRGTMRAWKSA